MNENVNSIKPPGDSISRSDAKDKAKKIMYSILDDTDYNDIESMAHALLMMKIKILKMFDKFPSATIEVIQQEDSGMTKEEKIKWLDNLKKDIGQPQHQELWHYEEVIDKVIESLSADMVIREDFEIVDNKLYLNPVCRNCKHSSYCNNIPVDENNEDIEHYDAYGRSVLSVRKCKNYEPESE